MAFRSNINKLLSDAIPSAPPNYYQSLAGDDKEQKSSVFSAPYLMPITNNSNNGKKIIPAELQTHHDAALLELKKMGAMGLGGKFQVAVALDISSSMQDPNKFFLRPSW